MSQSKCEAFAYHKANVKFMISVMELSSFASERSKELLSKREKKSVFQQIQERLY